MTGEYSIRSRDFSNQIIVLEMEVLTSNEDENRNYMADRRPYLLACSLSTSFLSQGGIYYLYLSSNLDKMTKFCVYVYKNNIK